MVAYAGLTVAGLRITRILWARAEKLLLPVSSWPAAARATVNETDSAWRTVSACGYKPLPGQSVTSHGIQSRVGRGFFGRTLGVPVCRSVSGPGRAGNRVSGLAGLIY
jgi:hypothetical protein